MIRISNRGSFKNINKFFKWSEKVDVRGSLEDLARVGTKLLAENTPVDTGLTAASWGYEITQTKNGYRVAWTNDNINDGVIIALIIQYGHGTGTGGWVQAVDYINPVMEPLFGKSADDFWEEVKNA